VICQIARSQAEDVERAIDAAHAAGGDLEPRGGPDRAISAVSRRCRDL
jgi:acyl-CoA reductase-like NAD-dependent aldehyde dehydrogenase